MYGVTDRASMQEFLDSISDGLQVRNDADIHLDGGITISNQIYLIPSQGWLIFDSGIEGEAALQIAHDKVECKGWRMSNPNALGNQETGSSRPYGIEIQGNDVKITDNILHQFMQPISQRSNGEWYNSLITGNICWDCLGGWSGSGIGINMGGRSRRQEQHGELAGNIEAYNKTKKTGRRRSTRRCRQFPPKPPRLLSGGVDWFAYYNRPFDRWGDYIA